MRLSMFLDLPHTIHGKNGISTLHMVDFYVKPTKQPFFSSSKLQQFHLQLEGRYVINPFTIGRKTT